MSDEATLIADADRRAAAYLPSIEERPAYSGAGVLAGLAGFAEMLPDLGRPDAETLALLDERGSPAKTASNATASFARCVTSAEHDRSVHRRLIAHAGVIDMR